MHTKCQRTGNCEISLFNFARRSCEHFKTSIEIPFELILVLIVKEYTKYSEINLVVNLLSFFII